MATMLNNYDIFLGICSFLSPKDILMLSMTCRTFSSYYKGVDFETKISTGTREATVDYYDLGFGDTSLGRVFVDRVVCILDTRSDTPWDPEVESFIGFYDALLEDSNVDVLVINRYGDIPGWAIKTQIRSVTFFNGYTHGMVTGSDSMCTRGLEQLNYMRKKANMSYSGPRAVIGMKIDFRSGDCCSDFLNEHMMVYETIIHSEKYATDNTNTINKLFAVMGRAEKHQLYGFASLVILACCVRDMWDCVKAFHKWEEGLSTVFVDTVTRIIDSVYESGYDDLYGVGLACMRGWCFLHKLLCLEHILNFEDRPHQQAEFSLNQFINQEEAIQGHYNIYNRYVVPGDTFNWEAIFVVPEEMEDEPLPVPILPPIPLVEPPPLPLTIQEFNPFILATEEVLDLEDEEADGVGDRGSPEHWYIGEADDELVGLVGGKRAIYEEEEEEEETNVKIPKSF